MRYNEKDNEKFYIKEGIRMAEFKCISIAEAKRRMQEETVKVVDIRDSHSFETDHIENAFHLTNDNISKFIADVDFKTPLFIICYSGFGSKGVAQYLADQGYTDSCSIDGGFSAWNIASL